MAHPSISPNLIKGVSFHISFHVKFGNMRFCNFSINNPQNSCLVTWLLTWNITLLSFHVSLHVSFHVTFHVTFQVTFHVSSHVSFWFWCNVPSKHMIGNVDFNVKDYILSRIFDKKIGCLSQPGRLDYAPLDFNTFLHPCTGNGFQGHNHHQCCMRSVAAVGFVALKCETNSGV